MKVFISGGDPGGIGYEILLKATHNMQDKSLLSHLFPVLSYQALQFWENQTSLKLPSLLKENTIFIEDNDHHLKWEMATISAYNGEISHLSLDKAIEHVTKDSENVLLTLPIHKKSMFLSGLDHFIGHTEYLAKKFHRQVTMVLANHLFAVGLVTTHYPLLEIPHLITSEKITQTAILLNDFAKKKKENPHIFVCGLNPHAGDHGLLGVEEDEIISPCVQKLSQQMLISGPYPSDSLFKLAYTGEGHFFIAMYHDQGLIPVKMLGQNETVNITLGLPFLRISVDHGTAFDIAGKNKANEKSLLTTFDWIFRKSNSVR